MLQVKLFEDHAQEYDQWFEDFPAIFQSELVAIKQQMLKLPVNIHGIEVGLGTGRFASSLGITEGVEPSRNMRIKAVKKGIEVMNATAERLPYKDLHFDFVLFVTICHLDDIRMALIEAHRVLKSRGAIIIGFIQSSGLAARSYEERRSESTFYKNATFYSVEKIMVLLKRTGFHRLDFIQTLFGDLDDITKPQSPRPGFDQGSFVVVKAEKK